MGSFSYGSRDSYSFDGNRPPYKIGRSFTMPTISSVYYAPDKSGASAQPCLITSVGIQVQGYTTNTPSTHFGIWESNGSGVVLSAGGALGASGSTTTAGWSDRSISRITYGGSSYIIGFTKESTETFLWNVDTGKSGNIIKDTSNSAAASSFKNDGNYESGSLVYRATYSTLPIAPVIGTATQVGVTNSITVTWTAPTDNGGQAVSGYRIQRSTDNATWSTIVSNTGSTVASYTDSSLTYGTTYYYRVAAHNLVSTTAGSTYSGAYSGSVSRALANPGGATDKTSYLTNNVHNTDLALVSFDDAGNGIPFNKIDVVFGGENFYTEVTASGNPTITDPQTVVATANQAIYGTRTFSVDGLLNATNTGVYGVAQEYLWRYYQPSLRVQSIGVILERLNPVDRATVLALELGDGVQVTFTPNKIGDPITRKCWIIGISWDVTLEYKQVTLKMQSAESEIFTLDSNVFGYLDTNILG